MPEKVNLSPAPPEFRQRIDRLIAAYYPHLAKARIRVQVRDKAPQQGPSATWAEVDTANNDAEKAEFDYSMWFALDVWAALDDYQRDALTFHELTHCGVDDAGQPLLIHHDLDVFNAELAVYGLWWGSDALVTLAAIEQMPALHGPEGVKEMPHGYGGYQRPMPGGSSGSTGAFADPHLVAGGDFMNVPIGDGKTIDLCPRCYQELAAFVFDQALAAMGGGTMSGQEPQPEGGGPSPWR